MAGPGEPTARTEESPDAKPRVGRRKFLTFLVAAPTLTVAAKFTFDPVADALPSLPAPSDLLDLGDVITLATKPTAWSMVLRVEDDGRVRFELPRAESGQGITTTAAMIIAEELGARLSDVAVELSDARPEFMWNQFTAGSTGVRTLWGPLRGIAATARARLITAAAKRLGVEAGTLTTRDSAVWAPDGRSESFGSLASAAASTTSTAVSTAPKDASGYTLIGQPTGRMDARDIVTGKAEYAMDMTIEGALATVVARPPTIKGTVASFDAAPALAIPGVVAVTEIPSGVAVSAETIDLALKGRDALVITWKNGPAVGLSDADIRTKLRSATAPLAVPRLLTNHLDASFDFGFVSHAPMEVHSAIADVREDSAEVWVACQSPIMAQNDVAKSIGLPSSKVKLHVLRAGGSFGRRLFWEPAVEAAQVSKKIGKPVRLMWTRTDDVRHGRLRPASHHKIRATYLLGEVLSFEHRMASVETDLKHGFGELVSASGAAISGPADGLLFFHLSASNPYHFGLVTQLLTEVPVPVHTGSWRSVYSAGLRTAEEVVVDELAAKMGKDPVQFRMSVLKSKRAKDVLAKVAKEGQWGKAMPRGWAQGVAVHEEYRSVTACLVEINATDPKAPRVTRATIAVDVGRAINPTGLKAQMMGGLMDAISTVLQAGVHLDAGKVREKSYADFRYARQKDAPVKLDVFVMPPTGEPGGAGELGVPAAAGAVANAYARATGTKPRSFPINF
ncbi:isoquinoline 1-oxidoreductase, beta subunit [Actinokineospora alba]|uniref:Isoquinoline 1-oxidoreductase, beta subunit n=1 Tax=Actinokineospora alba TaxID=504798 RepID=A0A1H0R0E1_9PSEU|nr:molybdopterin cofactor-binding domain-containing protein [Actinokineospora alba]TDP70306.1 isoquinoline 1-oxidoreductase beta subunit [Actinokineospora alba]SDI34525.1 isoquinoline 1-oxidoreductase, beta subunit [Actinokineospora alba]SDP22981.1 isoquinoline 1-oxidoreductase, beta subunit [Actinokineospora alba]